MSDLVPDSPAQRIAALAAQANGRCHACTHSRSFDLPHRTIFFCRAFAAEMTGPERDAVRDCARWTAFRPTDTIGRRDRAATNPLLADLLAVEDRLFAAIKQHLDALGLDLKTLLMLAQPSLLSVEDLAWIDTLEDRFDETPALAPLPVLIDELRAMHYDTLCELLESVARKFTDQETPDAC